MKKLTKKNLDELAKTMSVVSKDEQDRFSGMYGNDCFWRCVAYMENFGSYTGSGPINITEDMAEPYALGYFTDVMGGNTRADSYLNSVGAGMTFSDIWKYNEYANQKGIYTESSEGRYIGYFNTSNLSEYEDTGTGHAIIVLGRNSDGSVHIYDPQINRYSTIPAMESQYIDYLMY